MKTDERAGRTTVWARLAALGDAILALLLSLLAIDLVLPRRAGGEPDPELPMGEQTGTAGAPSER